MMDLSNEIKFKTSRSGGKGGQNVNKVETMVEAYWKIDDSRLISAEQKMLLKEKLAAKINTEGELMLKSRTERTQLGNKAKVLEKMANLVKKALIVPKKRKPTKISKAAKQKRIDSKKKVADVKLTRQKIKNW